METVLAGSAVVALDGVGVQRGSTRSVDAVTLQIGPGERVALVGPSGAGKTSLLSVMNTSIAVDDGSVRLFGLDPSLLDRSELQSLRCRIATVHQGLHLPGALKVIHNVNAGRLGAWSTGRALWSLIRPQHADDARMVLEALGIEHLLMRRTDSLSGGERQRVALARMVVQGADLVLADEPVASLDPARARDVIDALVTAAGVATSVPRALVVSLHAFDLARESFDRVIALRAGRVVFDLPASSVTDDMAHELYQYSPS
jgi:phosphonate transport system ATP-binding protein